MRHWLPHNLAGSNRRAIGSAAILRRLLALAVGAGPSGAALDFRHAARGSPATIDELGRLVLNTCQARKACMQSVLQVPFRLDGLKPKQATKRACRELGPGQRGQGSW